MGQHAAAPVGFEGADAALAARLQAEEMEAFRSEKAERQKQLRQPAKGKGLKGVQKGVQKAASRGVQRPGSSPAGKGSIQALLQRSQTQR